MAAKLRGKSLRNTLLAIYDDLAGSHDYLLDGIAEGIAEQYWNEYDGGMPKRKLMDDFRIVAISSLHSLDLIVSEDENSMKSGHAIRAYLKVNNLSGLRTPAFYSLKRLIP